MIILPFNFVIISINIFIIINKFSCIVAKENNQFIDIVLFGLSFIFIFALLFNVVCGLVHHKDETTDKMIAQSHFLMFWLFFIEIIIFFLFGIYSLCVKITPKDKAVTNKIEQNTIPLTNESGKTETKPIEDSVIKRNKNIEQTVMERGLAQNIANMQVKMEYYPLKKDFLYQIIKIEPKMIDINEISSELRTRLNNSDDDLELAEIEMNYAYTLLEETKQKLIKLEKEKYELENSKHRILKDPRGIFHKNILQSIKNNKSFLTNYESHFESAKFKYALLKWEQSSTEDEDSNIK